MNLVFFNDVNLCLISSQWLKLTEICIRSQHRHLFVILPETEKHDALANPRGGGVGVQRV